MAINLREKIQKITLHPIFKMDKAFSDITLSGIDADAILSIVREAVSAVKPHISKTYTYEYQQGAREKVSDYQDKILEVLS